MARSDRPEGVLDRLPDRCLYVSQMRFQRRLLVAVGVSLFVGGQTPAHACAARTAEAASHARTGGEPDRQKRREAAVALGRQGFHVDWRRASWTELHDWTLRAAEARRLRERYDVLADWRLYPLRELEDWEDRASRAIGLRQLGVEVDWRLYTAAQLEDLRLYLERARLQPPSTPPDAKENLAERVTLEDDPDGTLLPGFLTEDLSRASYTDDAILEPSFTRRRHHGPRTRPGPTSRGAGSRGHGIVGEAPPAAPKKRDRRAKLGSN